MRQTVTQFWMRAIVMVMIIATIPIYMGITHFGPSKMLLYSALAGPAYALGEYFTDAGAVWAGAVGFAVDAAVMCLSVLVFGGVLFTVALLFL